MTMNVTSEDKKGQGVDNNEEECPICHELYKSIAEKTFLSCAHYFHNECIDQWLAKDDSCPICRSFSKEETSQAAATVYPDANVVDVAAEAYATFAAMRQPQQMENGTNNSNITVRRTSVGCYNSTNCYNCVSCHNSDYCQNCTNSHNCDGYQNCNKCRNCDDCYNYNNCYNCTSCTNCTNCRN